MRVPDTILKSVAFIGVPDGAAKAKNKYKATGFFIEITDASLAGWRFRYFVTAAHVARKICDGKFTIRLNDGITLIAFEVSGEDIQWYFHPDPAIDVAVASWFPEQLVAHQPIPATMIMPDDALKAGGWLGIGDEAFIAGLYSRFHGQLRNFPIIRIGNIAMLPDEKHKTDLGDAYMYLIEARSTGGLSGSPVFARETVSAPVQMANGSTKVIDGGGQIFLIGLIHGHHDDKTGIEPINMGIAEVTPAERILEVLYLPELAEMRKQDVEESERSNLATMDMAVDESPQTQTTAKGLIIPVPDKKTVIDVFKKASRKRPKQ